MTENIQCDITRKFQEVFHRNDQLVLSEKLKTAAQKS